MFGVTVRPIVTYSKFSKFLFFLFFSSSLWTEETHHHFCTDQRHHHTVITRQHTDHGLCGESSQLQIRVSMCDYHGIILKLSMKLTILHTVPDVDLSTNLWGLVAFLGRRTLSLLHSLLFPVPFDANLFVLSLFLSIVFKLFASRPTSLTVQSLSSPLPTSHTSRRRSFCRTARKGRQTTEGKQVR